MARWYRRYNREEVDPSLAGQHHEHGVVAELPPDRVQSRCSENQRGSYTVGPVMKVKNFRLNVVFDSSVTVLWALVYVPEGLPIGRLSTSVSAGSQDDAQALYEPQQFIIASGLYSSVGTGGSSAGPLRVWTPLARNLNPGDGVFFVWKALTQASGVGTFFTLNYATCVN